MLNVSAVCTYFFSLLHNQLFVICMPFYDMAVVLPFELINNELFLVLIDLDKFCSSSIRSLSMWIVGRPLKCRL